MGWLMTTSWWIDWDGRVKATCHYLLNCETTTTQLWPLLLTICMIQCKHIALEFRSSINTEYLKICVLINVFLIQKIYRKKTANFYNIKQVSLDVPWNIFLQIEILILSSLCKVIIKFRTTLELNLSEIEVRSSSDTYVCLHSYQQRFRLYYLRFRWLS
jgi:hypothetical protein